MRNQEKNATMLGAIPASIIVPICLALAGLLSTARAETLKLEMLPGEYWWGGLSAIEHETPNDRSSVADHELFGENKGNQAQPLLLSSKGRMFGASNRSVTVSTKESSKSARAQGRSCPAALFSRALMARPNSHMGQYEVQDLPNQLKLQQIHAFAYPGSKKHAEYFCLPRKSLAINVL